MNQDTLNIVFNVRNIYRKSRNFIEDCDAVRATDALCSLQEEKGMRRCIKFSWLLFALV